MWWGNCINLTSYLCNARIPYFISQEFQKRVKNLTIEKWYKKNWNYRLNNTTLNLFWWKYFLLAELLFRCFCLSIALEAGSCTMCLYGKLNNLTLVTRNDKNEIESINCWLVTLFTVHYVTDDFHLKTCDSFATET